MHAVTRSTYTTEIGALCDRMFGVLLAVSLSLVVPNQTFAAPGDLDVNGFGTAGRVATLLPGTTRSDPLVTVIQPDGKIVVAGNCDTTAGRRLCIARLMANGSTDSAFGASGSLVFSDVLSSDHIEARLAAHPGGKLVVAGTCQQAVGLDIPRLCAIRLNGDGTRDASFGTAGKVVILAGHTSARLAAIATQGNGKLLLAGKCAYGESRQQAAEPICVARVDANGALDPGFGVGGVAAINNAAIDAFTAREIMRQTDGKIVLAGYCTSIAFPETTEACLHRIHSNGAIDTSFGAGGVVLSHLSTSNQSYVVAAAMQPDDQVIVAGGCGEPMRFCAARFGVRGDLDASFRVNANGIGLDARYEAINSLLIEADGKVTVAGDCRLQTNGGLSSCFARYNSDGSLDANLAAAIDDSVQASGRSVTTQTDGKIVVTSACVTGSTIQFCIARYEGGPFGYRQCSLDLDGDGHLNPAIDGLMLTRAVLGFIGPQVYAGINFPTGATRTQWGNNGESDIRKFLVTQCAMKL